MYYFKLWLHNSDISENIQALFYRTSAICALVIWVLEPKFTSMGQPFLSYNIHLPIERLVWILFGNLTVPLETNLMLCFHVYIFGAFIVRDFLFKPVVYRRTKVKQSYLNLRSDLKLNFLSLNGTVWSNCDQASVEEGRLLST